MLNRDKTFTVGDLLKMLTDGRITPDMPIAVYHRAPDCMVGLVATEIITYDDCEKVLTFYTGEPCASLNDIASTAELFP